MVVPGFSASSEDWCIPALLDLVRVLAGDHDIEVFALRYPFEPRRYEVAGTPVTALGGRDAAGLTRAPLLIRAVRAIRTRHRAAPFDVIHGLWADEAGAVAVAAAARLRRPAVVSFMGGELVAFEEYAYGGQRSRANRVLVQIAARRADAVTVGSRRLADQVTDATGRVAVAQAPLGTDVGRFSPDGPHATLAGDPPLLQVASLVGVKDHATALRALPAVLRRWPSAHLHLVGDGPLKAPLDQLAGELGIRAHVHLHGELSHERLPPLYRAARLHVQSSRFESQGMAVIEAAASGCSTAGTDVGLLPEIVPADHLTTPGDPAGLARAILLALDQPHEPSAVREDYALDRTVGRLVALYKQVIEG
jgi:glycosyltransferase involved in cell wall biosynthesis